MNKDHKYFFVRLGAVLVLVLCLSIVANILLYPALKLTPWSWGAELVDSKSHQLQNPNGKFNAVVLGSSRVYRQVDPQVVDSVTDGKAETRLFNLGANWLFPPESFYVYDHITKNENGHYDYIIIELAKVSSVDFKNLHTVRTIYWYNLSDLIFAITASWNSNFSIIEKGYNTFVHLIGYTDNIINLGYITEAVRYLNAAHSFDQKVNGNGFQFLSVDQNEADMFEEENTAKRNSRFLRDTSVVTKRSEISRKQFSKYSDNPKLLKSYNIYYSATLKKMITDAQKKGTQLIFLLSPRIDKKQYDELIPLFYSLPEENRIEISDSRSYPELYLAENSFDATHLNQKGSRIYSRILGEKLNDLVILKRRP